MAHKQRKTRRYAYHREIPLGGVTQPLDAYRQHPVIVKDTYVASVVLDYILLISSRTLLTIGLKHDVFSADYCPTRQKNR